MQLETSEVEVSRPPRGHGLEEPGEDGLHVALESAWTVSGNRVENAMQARTSLCNVTDVEYLTPSIMGPLNKYSSQLLAND